MKVWLGPQSVDPSLARRHEVIRSRSLGTGSTNRRRKNLMDTRLENKPELGSIQSSWRSGLARDVIKAEVGGVVVGQTKQALLIVINRKAAMDSVEANPVGDQ